MPRGGHFAALEEPELLARGRACVLPDAALRAHPARGHARSILRRRDGRALRPETDRATLAARLGRRADLGGRRGRRRAAHVLRARDAPVPQRRAAHRAPEELRRRRCRRALPPPHRPPRAAPDGLRRVRPARREPRDQDRPAPQRVHRRVDRRVPQGLPRVGHLDRLDARVRDLRPQVLPLDAVDLPAALRARPGLPPRGRRQVVPQRPDRARQRAGHRRALRALRLGGRGPPARAVAVPHHRLRRPAARRPRHHPVARARQDDAAQLDRPLRGRRGASSAATSWAPTTRCSRRARTPCSAPRSSSWPRSIPTSSAWPPARATRTRCAATSTTR